MGEISDTYNRLTVMAEFGISVERMDRLENGWWVVTCEKRIGVHPNDREIRAMHPYLHEAVSKAWQIFRSA